MNTYSIYGDNIVECERMVTLLRVALHVNVCDVYGSATAPSYTMVTADTNYTFHTYPGFFRWQNDIIKAVQNGGSVLRETPDVFITKVSEGKETPILSIEFCSALPAGNQAWQRSGRAYSIARCGIPYLFVTEIGGYELDENRMKKAPRLPNAAVPYSYISYAKSSQLDAMIIYQINPGADEINKARFSRAFAGSDFYNYIAAKIKGEDSSSFLDSLGTKVLSFILTTTTGRSTSQRSLGAQDWEAIYRAFLISSNPLLLYENYNLPWKKSVSIELKQTFQTFLHMVESIATGICSSNLPFCIIRKSRIDDFRQILRQVYPDFYSAFPDFNSYSEDLAICWIAGFKPRGDDARPDRGLLPFLRMLVGDKIKVLTMVYGPASSPMVDELEADPHQLAQNNGLWEAILTLSNFVICDSMKHRSYVIQEGWVASLPQIRNSNIISMQENVQHFPNTQSIGENDVDTVIHLLFAHILRTECFECMCNPPGGDWSGVSLKSLGNEYRWLTLPRVSATGSKRPDHVIQVDEDTIITIESKDYLSNLESDIGHRLVQYCKDLFSTSPSCMRNENGLWSDKVTNFSMPNLRYISVGAFIESSPNDVDLGLSKAKTDAVFVFSFVRETVSIKIKFGQTCDQKIKDILSHISIPDNIKLAISIL